MFYDIKKNKIDTIDEQLALQNLLGLDDADFEKMRAVEDEIIKNSEETFARKTKTFEKFLAGRTLREAILEEEEKISKESEKNPMKLRINDDLYTEVALKKKIKKLPSDKMPIIIAGGSFNAKGRNTDLTNEGRNIIKKLLEKIDSEKAYFVVGHKMNGYEKAVLDIAKDLNKNIEVDAIVPKMVSKEVENGLQNKNIGICISPESEDFGIYKSFNYEIFERRSSVVIAFDGNSPVSNLVQEAKNGKGKSKIYVNQEIPTLKEKANSLHGYVVPFSLSDNIVDRIIEDNPEIIAN